MTDRVKYDQDSAVATVTINRPDAMNSFTTELSLELQLALEKAAKGSIPPVVTATSTGSVLVTGRKPAPVLGGGGNENHEF